MAGIVATLIRCANTGEPWAVRELLDRCIGKSKPIADTAGEPKDTVVRYVVKVPGQE